MVMLPRVVTTVTTNSVVYNAPAAYNSGLLYNASATLGGMAGRQVNSAVTAPRVRPTASMKGR